jgi:hypothetical protein
MRNINYKQLLSLYDLFLTGQTDEDIKTKGEKYIRTLNEDGNVEYDIEPSN